MWLPFLALLVGVVLGTLIGFPIPAGYARYVAVGILAGFDAVLGAIRAETEGTFDNRIFLTGFVTNTLVAALLTFLADRLGVELYLAAIVAFGTRVFNNLAVIRRKLLVRE